MALVVKDRVKETTTTTGTGTINLAGAASGFQSFVSGVGDGNTTYYAITDANGAWEVGLGTVTDGSPDTLARTTVLATSNGDTSQITLSSGTHTVFGTYPAGKAVYLDASGNLSYTVDISSDTNLAAGTGITLTGDTLSTTDGEIVHDNLSGFVANEHIDWTTDQGATNIHSGNYTDTNTMGSGFTVSATTDTNATTITEGDDLFFAAGTGITCETTADGTVTIACTVTSGASDLNDLGDVSYGGTNLAYTILINNDPGSAPSHGTLGSDNARNLGIGYLALSSITDASDNIVLGGFAGWQLTQGDRNVFVGPEAGAQITDGDHNICIGYQTQYYGNEGDFNIAIGSQALRGNTDGTTTTGNYNNIGIGQQALYRIEDGDSNVAIGYKSANEIKDGQQNVAIGYQAQLYDETCDHNVAIGRDALKGTSSSDNQQYNTGVGATSLFAITTGSMNTAAGAYCGASLTTGDQNIYLGYGAGTGATATESDMLYIGNTTVSFDGTIIKADMSEKHLAIGMADDHFSNSVGSATLQIYPKDAADEAIFVKMPTSHSANLIQIQNSSGIDLFVVDSTGEITTGSISGGGGSGDITGVDLTGGVGISIDSETNTESGAYSSTITCNLEGTELASTGETGTSKFLRVDGDGTCSWQVPPDTDTTYTKASFDIDHLFTLVGASADTDENLGTFTGSTIADNQTIKAAIQAVETAVETKGATAGSSSIVTVGTISSGTWQGTAIAQAYIANDAINGDKIADDAVNSEHYAAGSIDEEHLNATNSPTDNYLLSYDDASGGFTWVAAGSGGENNEYSFKTISVAGQDDVVADTTTDTLTLAAGSNVTITTTAASDTVTIASTDTTYTKASFDLDHLFVLVGASADTDENLGTFTGSTISDSRTIKQALQDLETELETKTTNTGDITGVDLTGGVGISIDSETNTGSGAYSSTITCNLEGTELASTGETGTSKFLRVDGDGTCSWQVPPDTDTNTTYTGGTNLTLAGTTFNVDDAFLVNDADDATTGTITAGGFTTSGTLTVDSVGISTIQSSGESFADNDTSLMTSAAIDDRINAAVASEDTLAELNDTNISSAAAGHLIIYDNTASVWDNATLTAGSNISITNGDGSITIAATDTNTTYAKADFDLDHLFTLVGASADTSEHLGTFTGSTISDNQTIKAAIQALETAVETKGAGDITGVDLTGGTGISIDSETNTGSGAYSSTITCNLEGTELASTGETGTAKFLRVDGDGTCSWQVPPDTDTTYTKASFDLDHLFALAGASADTDENLGTFTGSTISDSRTIKQALQDLETELETKGVGDMTGVDLTGGTGISIDSETNTGSGAYSSTITCNLEGTELASTGETGTAKFLRVDGDGTCSWQVPPDTNTTYAKADFDIDHLFTLVGASADTDENLGTFTGSTISDSRTIKQALQDLETELETKTTNTGDITGVDLTGGTGISIDSETNTGSGAYSSPITCNLEGTELASTGETGTTKFLRVDGDGTCSWQVPPDTNTTYSGGTNLTLDGTTFNVDDAFLKNNANDTTSGTVTMANLIVGDAGNIGSASATDAIAIASDGEVTLSQRTTFSKAVKTPLKSNTDGATITFDLDEASTHTVTLGDNRTLAISNEDAGQKFIINLVQDGTGSRTVTWFSTIKWAGGSAPTLTTTANKADSFGFLCTGTDAYYGFVIGQNI